MAYIPLNIKSGFSAHVLQEFSKSRKIKYIYIRELLPNWCNICNSCNNIQFVF